MNDIRINFRIPLNSSTASEIFAYASEAKKFLKSIGIDEKHTHKLPDGSTKAYYVRKLAIKSSKFTPFFGFVNSLTALEGLYTDLVLNGPLDEFHTFMFSQDHLETWFSAMRSGLGIIYCQFMLQGLNTRGFNNIMTKFCYVPAVSRAIKIKNFINSSGFFPSSLALNPRNFRSLNFFTENFNLWNIN